MKLAFGAIAGSVIAAAAFFSVPSAQASPHTVYCRSVGDKYTECPARFQAPILVMQKSQKPCIINSSWGYNPNTGRIWVARGCIGVFADQHGYHHGASGTMDIDARRYSDQGEFIGYGAVVPVQNNHVVQFNIGSSKSTSTTTIHSTSVTNIYTNHDVARITEPDTSQDVDPTPQFDRNGEPNFDTEGNYIGGHGLGTLVDSPDAGDGSSGDSDGGGDAATNCIDGTC
jgi:hypothetical protein